MPYQLNKKMYSSYSSTTTPIGHDNKADWYKLHNKHMKIACNSEPNIILCGDSIVSGLSRYPDIWNKYIRPCNAMNMGIGGDKTQHALWRAENFMIPKTVSCVVIHCGTNNIDYNVPHDIANGVISIGLAFQKKKPNLKIIITELLPRDSKWSSRRNKIIEVNRCLEHLCRWKVKGFSFMKQDLDWTLCDHHIIINY